MAEGTCVGVWFAVVNVTVGVLGSIVGVDVGVGAFVGVAVEVAVGSMTMIGSVGMGVDAGIASVFPES